ncbi:uncharacterized protein LOC111027775 [Myzus persicae]|uniref:uncharacterized protein LOC111027775 n=1 Tax=Myzus persicae TaxID=13164 RepID=UPI000B938B60|nr:uncharacterized protein LOC111027775 [Myzus persicae]
MAESQNISKVVFMPDQEEKLIEEVRNNSELYDLSKPSHKDIILKDDIWKNISLKVGRSVDDCKRRWKNIKDTYNRNKRKLGTGSAASSKKKWILADRVSFLNSVDNERNSTSNIDTPLDDDVSVDTDDEIDVDNSNKDDNVELPTCSFAGINEAKMKTLMLVNELQERYANPPQITTPSFFPIQNFQQNQQHYYGVSNPQNISPISYSDSDRSQTSSSAISYPTSINPQTIAPSHMTFSPTNDFESTSSPAYFNNSN